MTVHYHEAAHAVVNLLLGVPFTRIWCDGRRGAVELGRWRDRGDGRMFWAVAVSTAAGGAEDGRESAADLALMDRCVRGLGVWGAKERQRWTDLARRRAARMLDRPTVANAVFRLGLELRRRGELTGEEATALIRDAMARPE